MTEQFSFSTWVAEKLRGDSLYRQWEYRKGKYIKENNLKCVFCGEPAQSLHHPKKYQEYERIEDYYSEPFEDLVPVCHRCHATIHGRKPRPGGYVVTYAGWG